MRKVYREVDFYHGLNGVVMKAYFGDEFLYYVVRYPNGHTMQDGETDINEATRLADVGR